MFFSSFLLAIKAIFRGLTVIDIDHPDLRFPYHLSISLSIYWFLYTEYATKQNLIIVSGIKLHPR